jgi:hypothetical protein
VAYTNHQCMRMIRPEQNPWKEVKVKDEDGKDVTTYENDWTMLNKAGKRRINTSRFHVLSRLNQYYLVEGLSRAVDYRLKLHKNNRALIFGVPQEALCQIDTGKVTKRAESQARKRKLTDSNGPNGSSSLGTPRASASSAGSSSSSSASSAPIRTPLTHSHSNPDQDPEREVAHNSHPSYLGESFGGSPRHLKKCAENAMTIVSEKGDGTAFITLTANALWPEIQEKLLPSQDAFDRPDIVAQVFKARLAAFLTNLRSASTFIVLSVFVN